MSNRAAGRGRSRALAAIAAAFVLASCTGRSSITSAATSGPNATPTTLSPGASTSPTPSPSGEPIVSLPSARELARGSRAVAFRATDGVLLAGRLFGGGTTGVVLAHMGAGDQRDWWPVAALLSSRGYRVLTFDFRGFCPGGLGGCSRGAEGSGIDLDLTGAVRFMAAREGVEEVWVGGASLGAIASLAVAEEHPDEVAGLIWVSGVELGAGFVFGPRDVRRLGMPKLIMAGRDEPGEFAPAARHVFRWATAPKRLLLLPTDRHGLDMLNRDVVSVSRGFREAIVGFLQRHAPIAD